METRGILTKVFLLVLVSTTLSFAGPLDPWQRRDPGWPALPLLSVAYGNGLYVAVGGRDTTRGVMVTSSNGVSWMNGAPNEWGHPTNRQLYTVAFGNGRFVVVGENYLVLTSEDGQHWTRQLPGHSINGYSIKFCGDRFLTSGNGPPGMSTNGVDWAEFHIGTNNIRAMTFANGTYVGVGYEGTIITSTNASEWVVRSSDATNWLFDVTFAQNLFVAVGSEGRILTSPDAQNWTSRSSGTTWDLYCVSFGDGKFVAGGYTGKVLYSFNGIDWSLSPSSAVDREFIGLAYLGDYKSIVYGDNQFVAVGGGSGGAANVYLSPDGIIWRSLFGGLAAVTDGDQGFVAVGEIGSVRRSTSGSEWTNETVGVGQNLNGVTFGMGKYVAVGDVGAVCVSTNAIDWEVQKVGSNTLNAVAFGNGTFVAVGSGLSVCYSKNGTIWQTPLQLPLDSSFRTICYGAVGFVTPGLWGSISVSKDGDQWLTTSLPESSSYRSSAYGKGIYVLVGWNSKIATSTDGTNWISRSAPGSGDMTLVGASFINGVFVAVAYDASVIVSSDGTHWVRGDMGLKSPGNNDLIQGLAANAGTLVAVGRDGGRIMQSAEVFSLAAGRWLPGFGQELTLAARRGAAYRIQNSQNLVTWDDLNWVTNETGLAVIVDASATSAPYRFYRAVLP